MRVGRRTRWGRRVRGGRGPSAGVVFPWAGDTNVAGAFIADAEFITLAGSDAAVWTAQQAYTKAGAPTTYTLAQGDTGSDPEFLPTGLNGKGALNFNGTSEWLGTTNADFLALANDASGVLTTIAVWQLHTVSGTRRSWDWSRSDLDTQYVHRVFQINDVYRAQRRTSTVVFDNASRAPSTDLDTTRVYTIRDEFTDVSRFWNGTIDAGDPASWSPGTDVPTLHHFTIGAGRPGTTTAQHFTEMTLRAFFVVRHGTGYLTSIESVEDWAYADQGITP